MSKSNYYRPAGPHIVHDSIDSETVVINLDSGDYYSLDSLGSQIWQSLLQSVSVERLSQRLETAFQPGEDSTTAALGAFLAQLEQEGLVVQSDGPEGEEVGLDVKELIPGGVALEFSAPTLQKYTDMQELLALDPIHEVDEAGWPKSE